MALHQINEKTVLNDEEYAEHQDINWILILFSIGAIIAGTTIYQAFDYFQLDSYPKWVKFIAISLGGLISGVLLAKIRRVVQVILAIAIGLASIGGIGYVVWENI